MKRFLSVMTVLILVFTLSVTAFARNDSYVDPDQPDTCVIGGYSVAVYAKTAEELDALCGADRKPAQVVFNAGEGVAETAKKLLAAKILPVVRVETAAEASEVCAALQAADVRDVSLMSPSGEAVKTARLAYPLIRGILDLSAEFSDKTALTKEEMIPILDRANESLASIVVLSSSVADPDTVKYIEDRLVCVWTMGPADGLTKTDAMRIFAAGGHGCIVADAEPMFSLILDDLACDYILLRAPLDVGHRGIPSLMPENTVAGALKAYESGAEAIELDIWTLRDGELAVIHNDRTGGLYDVDVPIVDQTAETLKNIHLNGWQDDERFKGATLPLLRDFYEAFKDKDCLLVVEYKGNRDEIADIFAEQTNAYGMADRAVAISFSSAYLSRLGEVMPTMSSALLTYNLATGVTITDQIGKLIESLQPLYTGYDTTFSGYTEKLIMNANLRGIAFWGWTSTQQSNFDKAFFDGYGAITTNNVREGWIYAKRLIDSTPSAVAEGEPLPLHASILKYDRSLTDVSADVRVIPLEGTFTVTENGLVAEDDFTYALEYTFCLDEDTYYSLLTQPHSVDVVREGEEQPSEPETSSGVEETDEDESMPWIPFVIGGAVVVAAVIVVILLKKKK